MQNRRAYSIFINRNKKRLNNYCSAGVLHYMLALPIALIYVRTALLLWLMQANLISP
jgi:hypothetical protein